MSYDWWSQAFPDGQKSLKIRDRAGRNVRISYGEKGEGQPLFLMHGIGSWSYGWRHLIEPLSRQFRVICFDAKGHGFSDKPWNFEDPGYQIDGCRQIIEQLCDRPAVIVGQSLGALIALAMVQEYPQLCSHLVLINVPIFLDELPNWWMNLLAYIPLKGVQAIDRLQWVRGVAPIVRKTVKFFRREVVVDPTKITSEEVYWITYPYIEFPGAISNYVEDLQIALRQIQSLQRKQPNFISRVREKLPETNQPTLILWGKQDRWFSFTHGEKLHQCLPNSTLKLIKNCGHDAAAVAPQVIEAETIDFLARNSAEFSSIESSNRRSI